MNADSILKSVEAVTKKWTKPRKAEERGKARATRRTAMVASYRVTIRDAAWKVMKEAYLKVSDDGKLPAAARQIMYAARPRIQEATEQPLDSQYFCQKLLPDYVASHSKETADWDITYDARGHFAEPHTELITPLGTLDVRDYLRKIDRHFIRDVEFSIKADFPTMGPEHRFGAVMFIEKEGFLPLFKKTQLAERYDLAIMSTKGMPVVACRHLADSLCGRFGIPLLVLHDFDKAGFSILGTLCGFDHWDRRTLADRPTRYSYRHEFPVIDLGLRLHDVKAHALQSEVVQYRSDPRHNLQQNGAAEEEIAFLCEGQAGWIPRGRRVELNAFTSRGFVGWIETKLRRHGVKKILPDGETLEAAYRRALQIALVNSRAEEIIARAADEVEDATVPKGLGRIVRRAMNKEPTISWDKAIAAIAEDAAEDME